jgi:hypothetical protein
MPEQQKPGLKVLPDHHSDFPVSVSFDWWTIAAVVVGALVLFLGLRRLKARRRR